MGSLEDRLNQALAEADKITAEMNKMTQSLRNSNRVFAELIDLNTVEGAPVSSFIEGVWRVQDMENGEFVYVPTLDKAADYIYTQAKTLYRRTEIRNMLEMQRDGSWSFGDYYIISRISVWEETK